jgi:hypothetical protein
MLSCSCRMLPSEPIIPPFDVTIYLKKAPESILKYEPHMEKVC